MEQESLPDDVFVGLICSAASQLRMRAAEIDGRYVFIDPLTKQAIAGSSEGSSNERLMSACKELQKYLSIHA